MFLESHELRGVVRNSLKLLDLMMKGRRIILI